MKKTTFERGVGGCDDGLLGWVRNLFATSRKRNK